MNFDKILKEQLLKKLLDEIEKEINTADNPTELEKLEIINRTLIYPIKNPKEPLTKEQMTEEILKYINHLYNYQINCAGYELKIDTCLFSCFNKGESAQEHLDRNISELLNKFPFVRLLGDTELQGDEYLVEYRADDDGGHHFVRIDSDGVISHKCSACTPEILNDEYINNPEKAWPTLLHCPSAILAVKSEHDMHHIGWYHLDGKNFEETALEAIESKSKEFEYHNRKYSFNENKPFVYSENEPVAEIMTEGDETIIVELHDKRNYISNTQSSTFKKYLEILMSRRDNKKPNNEISFSLDI